uniref:Uncharacterized protein n=1 Tax=viral metagenome TaxID=1070528 RepID=A0A6M3XPU7_9ZZZZ
MWKYILSGQGMRAMAVHSDLNLLEFQDFIREHSERLHADSYDTVFRWSAIEFINPKVFTRDSFVDYIPALIEVK